MKKIISSLLVMCVMLVSILPTAAVAKTVADQNLTTDFVVDIHLQETLNTYFDLRNQHLSGDQLKTCYEYKDCLATVSSSQEVNSKMFDRLSAKDNLALYHNVFVVDSSIEFTVNNVKEISPSIYEVDVYEWTWIWYNDGNGGKIDEMGYATEHILTLKQNEDNSFTIMNDLYDDSDILGARTTPSEIAAVMNTTTVDATAENRSTSVNSSATSGLYVDTLVEYADTWVPHTSMPNSQNPEYYNTTKYTVYAADCANYVSQCLMEGGMQNDYVGEMNNEDWTGNQWWFRVYESADIGSYNASPPAWRVVEVFSDYWTSKGYSLVTATNSTVFAGNPVILNGGHLMICVGYNSQGAPVLNAHNSDRYHLPLSMVTGTLTTIQIIGMKHSTHTNFTYSPKDLYVHACRCTACRNMHDEGHTWISLNSSYRCSKCLATSSFIPVLPSNIPEDILTKVQQTVLSGDFTQKIDDTTVLCRIDDQYYFVKGRTETDAMQFLIDNVHDTQ